MVIPVDLGTRSYSIVVEPGALASVGTRLRELRVGSRAVLMTDAGISRCTAGPWWPAWKPRALGDRPRGADGEAAKTLGSRALLGPAAGGGRRSHVHGARARRRRRRRPGRVSWRQRTCAALTSCRCRRRSWHRSTPPSAARPRSTPEGEEPHRRVLPATPGRGGPGGRADPAGPDFRSGLAEIVKHGVVLDAAYFDDVERSATALDARDLPP